MANFSNKTANLPVPLKHNQHCTIVIILNTKQDYLNAILNYLKIAPKPEFETIRAIKFG